jgi:hypothetical protein
MSKTIKLIINPSILDDPGLISKLMSAGIHTHTMYPDKKPAQSPLVMCKARPQALKLAKLSQAEPPKAKPW